MQIECDNKLLHIIKKINKHNIYTKIKYYNFEFFKKLII